MAKVAFVRVRVLDLIVAYSHKFHRWHLRYPGTTGEGDLPADFPAERRYVVLLRNLLQRDGFRFLTPNWARGGCRQPRSAARWRKPFTDLMNFDDLPLQSADHEQARSK